MYNKPLKVAINTWIIVVKMFELKKNTELKLPSLETNELDSVCSNLTQSWSYDHQEIFC